MSLLHSFYSSRICVRCAIAWVTLAASATSNAADGDVYESASVGTKLSFSASADGNPLPTFQWMKDGVTIAGATAVTLILPSATTADSGVYNALAKNSEGWALSNDLILTINSTNVAPSFTLQPFPSATAPEGSPLTLSAAAAGTPTPTYQWRKNGAAISGATDATLSFPALKLSDSATYSVVASNLAGTATSQNSVLTVVSSSLTVAPIITTQPLSQTVVRKTTVTFTVAASGTPAPTYQWYKNGGLLSGATNSRYTIASVGPANAGTYTALATNSAGSALSQGAVLKVTNK